VQDTEAATEEEEDMRKCGGVIEHCRKAVVAVELLNH
jgi:hypothetical protein